ncbi:MAG: neutral/alkaline non-lysosomal ceramidase N-terminal domain-containing protein [Cyclobacteriaceae bacterium]
MVKIKIIIGVCSLLFCHFLFAGAPVDWNNSPNGWKAGVAKVKITPQESMWMRGYSSRNRPSDGTLHDLWAKALVLEDAGGEKAVLLTLDLCIIQKSFSDLICDRLQKIYKFNRSQIILSLSHTHSGPTIRGEGDHIYFGLNEADLQQVEQYSDKLEDQLIAIVGEALESMVPVKLASGKGVSRFGVNRRNNNEKEINQLNQLEGPIDHSVPVIKVTSQTDKLLAVVFGYACHATVLNFYQWSGDYPGLAQAALEQEFPGTTAMFFAGTGADINPLPRRTVYLAEQYGNSLAAAVKRVLNEPMRDLKPKLKTKYSEIELSYSAFAANSVDKGSRTGTYPYPIQVWRIGEQNLIALGGEVVVDYGIQLKKIFGQDLFVMAYANAVMGYVPSLRVLKEGGYEGTKALNSNDGPSIWKPDIETLIIKEVLNLADQVELSVTEYNP